MAKTGSGNGQTARLLIYHMATLLSMILVPLLVLAGILCYLIIDPGFHTTILKRMNIVQTYIEAYSIQREKAVRDEIENTVGLDEFKKKYDMIQAEYNRRKTEYDRVNRTGEYDSIERTRNELKKLTWDRAPGNYLTEKDFDRYKKTELTNLNKRMDEIEDYRDSREDEIEKAEDSLDEMKSTLDDARDTLEDKEEAARDIIDKHRETFSQSLHQDIARISPVLTEILNTTIIDRMLEPQIRKFLLIFTDYFEQRERGTVFRDRLHLENGTLHESDNIRLPEIKVSLWVEEDVNGVRQKRHLISQIFSDKVREMQGIENKDFFLNLFSLAETGFGEWMAEYLLKNPGISIQDGVITLKPVVLSGENANKLERIMLVFTLARYGRFVFPVLAILMLLLTVISAPATRSKRQPLRRVLFYPGLVILGFSLVCAFLLPGHTGRIPALAANPIAAMYARSMFHALSWTFFIPVAVVFGTLAAVGFIAGIKSGGGNNDTGKTELT